MSLVGYWIPEGSADTLVYILAYPSKEAREAAWKAFGADPNWKKAFADSRKDGALVKKVDSVFLSATDYSPIQ
ncbi:MAG: NIPSNAP family protein, partial [Roseibacillus sp.]|nr:NIPSNAP family protein [Roseibacillus sp.]